MLYHWTPKRYISLLYHKFISLLLSRCLRLSRPSCSVFSQSVSFFPDPPSSAWNHSPYLNQSLPRTLTEFPPRFILPENHSAWISLCQRTSCRALLVKLQIGSVQRWVYTEPCCCFPQWLFQTFITFLKTPMLPPLFLSRTPSLYRENAGYVLWPPENSCTSFHLIWTHPSHFRSNTKQVDLLPLKTHPQSLIPFVLICLDTSTRGCFVVFLYLHLFLSSYSILPAYKWDPLMGPGLIWMFVRLLVKPIS